MTNFSWLTRVMCSAVLLLGIGCGGKTHVVGVADGGAGGDGSGLGGTASSGGTQGSGGTPGQDGPTSGGGTIATDGATGSGGSTSFRDAATATGGIAARGGATGTGGAGGAVGRGGSGPMVDGGGAPALDGPLGAGGIVGTGGAGSGGAPIDAGGTSGAVGAGGGGGNSGSGGSSGSGGAGGSLSKCEQRNGTCESVPLTAEAYAWCVSESGSCKLPAPATQGALGCATNADGVIPICCLPQWDQPTGQCANAGGVCYPMDTTVPGNVCPLGWAISNATCEAMAADCCVPPLQPICASWP